MSNHPDLTRNVSYDPLPLTNDDHSSGLYNAPPSPDPRLSSFHTPMSNTATLPDESLPLGAAQSRFMGTALYDDPSAVGIRESFASSTNTIPGQVGSEYNNSLYALNDPSTAGRFEGGYRDDPTDNYDAGEQGVPMSPVGHGRILDEKRAVYAAPRSKSTRKVMILGIIAATILVILAVFIPVYFAVIKPKTDKAEDSSSNDNQAHRTSSSSPASPTSSGKPTVAAAVTGGDGSTVTMEDGTTFTYHNSFGGYWYWDENDPFNNGAKAQSWSPALNETFKYGVDKMRGVNLGGWLNTEPFIVPALYEQYLNKNPPAVDEWTLSEYMAADTANGGLSQMENHYKTFITERDFAEIASAGLNFLRIPIGYWAIEVRDGEPFLPKVSWTYFLKAIKWARKYGLRINLDLHALPGSQNGWNHSGRLGNVNFLNGPMGYANAQRSLDYIRIIAEFISQPQYKDVVTIFGIINEPQASVVGQDALSRFYKEAYDIVRNAGGTGEGNGPYVSIHDGFLPRTQWADVFPNADRMTLDSHPYLCFQQQSDADMSTYAQTPCQTWGASVNNSMESFGLTNAGEFSNAVTDCGLWLNGVNLGTRYEGTYTPGNWPRMGDCQKWTDWQSYDDNMKESIMNFALASMDALQDYFFWTWKIGNSSVSGKVETPAWSYQLGLENGWMPKDPRKATGVCGNSSPWQPPLSAWQTGGAGAGSIPASASSALAWPPASLSNVGTASTLPPSAITSLPSYTPTGPIPTLSAPTFAAQGSTSAVSVDVGNGWANAADTQGVFVAIPTCSYLDPWIGPLSAPPSPLCSGDSAAAAAITSPPTP